MNNIPTPDDVAAVIEREGQWGKLPRTSVCKVCDWRLFGANVCPNCKADQRVAPEQIVIAPSAVDYDNASE